MSKTMIFSAIAAAQLCLITGLYLEPAWSMTHGKVVTVMTTPVDPHDFFRGEYAQLSYGFTDLPTDQKIAPSTTVYAVLAKRGNIWHRVGVSESKPSLKSGEIILKGKTDQGYYDRKTSTQISYGIERLYLQEGKSLALQNRRSLLRVELAVNADGRAIIRKVFDGATPLYDGTKTLSL